MVTCPRGHSSSATDYCDECGAPIGGGTPGAAAAAPAAPPVSAPPAASGGGAPCPDCDTPRTGRFCEVCGHDFLAEPAVPAAAAAPDAAAPDAAAPSVAAPDIAASIPVVATDPAAVAPAAAAAQGSGPVAGWRVVVSADREYFERMRAAWGPDADEVTFPAYSPQRVFELTGQQLLIGRRSRSRGVAPEIDLTGPPEDVGVSHTHALLVGNPDGTWSVVDLDSANGTYLNAGTGQLAAHTPTPLHSGDTVHVGAWTTLTVQVS